MTPEVLPGSRSQWSWLVYASCDTFLSEAVSISNLRSSINEVTRQMEGMDAGSLKPTPSALSPTLLARFTFNHYCNSPEWPAPTSHAVCVVPRSTVHERERGPPCKLQSPALRPWPLAPRPRPHFLARPGSASLQCTNRTSMLTSTSNRSNRAALDFFTS